MKPFLNFSIQDIGFPLEEDEFNDIDMSRTVTFKFSTSEILTVIGRRRNVPDKVKKREKAAGVIIKEMDRYQKGIPKNEPKAYTS